MPVDTKESDLPFQSCNQNDLLGDVLQNQKNSISNLCEELPFSKCSDFTIISECMSARKHYFQMFENNDFLLNCHNIIEETTKNSYSCKYYNEDSFNFMITKHQKSALKVFHLNIRSLNKHCHELNAY